MKYLFIVQGEGRGHLTQAISLSSILRRNGHQVVGCLVGKSKNRVIPKFFFDKINTETITYESPNFVWNKEGTDVNLFQTIIYNTTFNKLIDYHTSMSLIHNEIKSREPDVVINFYELLSGLTNFIYKETVPFISIAHQYLIMHSEYKHKKIAQRSRLFLILNAFLSSYGSSKRLGLSFYKMEDDKNNNIYSIPPILRNEVLNIKPKKENYILAYIVSKGFAEEIMKWHYENIEQKIHVFWDNDDLKIDNTLMFHKISDTKFLKYLANCKVYVSTAGFESICEAMYLGKSIMMIPTHAEQRINAQDAQTAGIGIESNDFNISKILNQSSNRNNKTENFKKWVDSAETNLIYQLTNINQQDAIKQTHIQLSNI